MSHNDESDTISFYITLRDSERASYETPQCAHTDVTVLELRHPPAALRWYQARAGGSADRMKLQLYQTINEGPLQLPGRHCGGRIQKKSHAGPHDALSSLGKHAPGETSSTKSTSELWSELVMKHSNGQQKRWRSVRLRSPDVRQSLFGLPAAPQKIWTTVKLNGNQMSHQQSAHPSYFSSINYCVPD